MHELLISSRAERDLKRLPGDDYRRLISAIRELAGNPRRSGCKKLLGSEDDWRIRVGRYRVLYEIDDAANVVRIFRARHRKEAYRGR
jgi:mRNA interferase RelE/StbE